MYKLYTLYRDLGIEWIVYSVLIANGIYDLSVPRERRVGKLAYILLNAAVYAALMPLIRAIPFVPLFQTQGAAVWAFFAALIAVSTLCAILCLRSNHAALMGYIIFYVVFLLLYKMVCSPFYSVETSMSRTGYAIADVGLTAIHFLLLILMTELFKRVRLDIRLPFLPRAYSLALFFPLGIFVFFMLYAGGVPIGMDAQRSILCAILLVDLPIIYYIFATVVRSYNDRAELDRALIRSQVQLDSLKDAVELDERIRKERHELKNNYFYLQALLRQGKADEADAYISDVIGRQLREMERVATGNVMLDHILNRKIAEARERAIPVCTEIVVHEAMSINEDALCTILLNLLDNAIEASEKLADPDLRISIREMPGYLLCKISNRIDRDVLKKNPLLATTKRDKAYHGLGLKIVAAKLRSIAKFKKI